MSSRPSDQWLKREDVVIEASEAFIGLVTVNIGSNKDITLKAGSTVFQGTIPWSSLGTTTLGTGVAYIGLVTTVDSGYSFKHFINANTSLATTFAVKGSAGIVHTVTVGGVSNPTIGLFNHATTATNPVLTVLPGTATKNFLLDENLTNGIVVEYGEGETAPLNISYK